MVRAQLMYQANHVAKTKKMIIVLVDEETLVDFYRAEAPRTRRATLHGGLACSDVVSIVRPAPAVPVELVESEGEPWRMAI